MTTEKTTNPILKEGFASNPETVPAKGDLSGSILMDRYRLIRRLGGGGMGDVYLGEHTIIGKKVAVKIMHSQYSEDREVVERFLQEARSASRIGHANIVDIADYGQTQDGRVFLVMEYLDGIELGDVLFREGRIPWQRACRIAIQVCNALQAAHEKNVIHRDLKPGNIFLTTFANQPDFVKVIDFGIAKVLDENEGHKMTKTGMILGTPDYMSPEQATGKPVTPATDIYSLGVILYEMLTGKPPFESDSFMGVLSQHMFDPPPPLRERCPEALIPEALENITLKALAKAPEDRFESMKAFADALSAIDDSGKGPPITVPAFRPLAASSSPGRGRLWMKIWAAVIVLLAATAVAVWFLKKPGEEPMTLPAANPLQETTTAGTEPAMPSDGTVSPQDMNGADAMNAAAQENMPSPPPPDMPAEPAVVTLSLSVNLPGAICTVESGMLTVLRDGKPASLEKGALVGKLPINQMEIVPQKDPVTLRVSHPGAEDLLLPLLFDRNLSIERVLTPKVAAPMPPSSGMKRPMTDPTGELLTPEIE